MEVILCQDIEKLGKVGDVLTVKEGYARNFLFPKKLAYAATSANLKKIESERKKKNELEKKTREDAEELAQKLGKVSCTVTVEVNDLEKLYGSVTEIDIAKALEEEGYSIDKKAIILEKSIEDLGIYDVSIKLHPAVIAKVRLWVTKK
ncbi:MAG: 50S ribosomal protein L9 [Candidatus Omnitrophota bacterium]